MSMPSQRRRPPIIPIPEKLNGPRALNGAFDIRTLFEYTDCDEEARTHQEAMRFLSEQFHIEVDSGYRKLRVEVADPLNRELTRFRNVFGTVGFIDKVIVDSPSLPSNADAGYEPNIHALLLRSDYQEPATDVKRLKVRGEPVAYQRSTGSSSHVYRHEIAHSFYHFVVQRVDSDAAARAKELHTLFFKERNGRLPKGIFLLSKYAQDSEKEMFAETVAQIMDKGAQSSFACAVVKYVIFGGNINDFK